MWLRFQRRLEVIWMLIGHHEAASGEEDSPQEEDEEGAHPKLTS